MAISVPCKRRRPGRKRSVGWLVWCGSVRPRTGMGKLISKMFFPIKDNEINVPIRAERKRVRKAVTFGTSAKKMVRTTQKVNGVQQRTARPSSLVDGHGADKDKVQIRRDQANGKEKTTKWQKKNTIEPGPDEKIPFLRMKHKYQVLKTQNFYSKRYVGECASTMVPSHSTQFNHTDAEHF